MKLDRRLAPLLFELSSVCPPLIDQSVIANLMLSATLVLTTAETALAIAGDDDNDVRIHSSSDVTLHPPIEIC
ncbi:hypothetical protein NKH64_28940 [Mesorhizobium sp. M0999]|uniref:hypothetical protein n=1 Tax=Mesorhizobium sp. M0999 TaxID=2957045 RepID=UPI00333DC3F0